MTGWRELLDRWLPRGARTVSAGEDFTLPGGRVVRVGNLWLSRQGHELVVSNFDEQRVPIESLPLVVGEHQIVLVGASPKDPVIRVEPWRGIRIRVGRADFSYAAALAQDWPPDEPPLFRPYPKLVVGVSYVFDGRALRESGTPIWGAEKRIGMFVVETETGIGSPGHSVQECQRVEFTSKTGVHPSYAPDPPPPPQRENEPERLIGEFLVDVGPYLPPPAVPMVLRVHAALGPYRSNEVPVTVRP